jgi:hypothetical protein
MQTDSPGPVVRQIGSIEDGLATEQNAHADMKALTFQLEQQLKMIRAGLYRDVEGPNKEARDARVDEQLETSPTYIEWVEAKTQLVKHEVRLEYLGKRLMACQSVLKHFQWDASAGQYGQGQPQGDR